MRRSVIRSRKEFLEKREKEKVHQLIAVRKAQFNDALQHQTPLPGHLKKDALALKKFSELDDNQTKRYFLNNDEKEKDLDDEYANAGVEEPRVLVTTSRNASQKLLEFAKEVRLIIPNAVRLNRGNHNKKSLMEAVRKENYSDLIIVQESQGVPDSLIISHLPLGPTIIFTIHNLVTRHEIKEVGTMSEQYPHLIFENFSTPLGLRIKNILKYLFPVPKEEGVTRVLTFDNNEDFISFRHHTFSVDSRLHYFSNSNNAENNNNNNHNSNNLNAVQLTEVGPRFELTPYKIMLGTLDMDDAEVEWVLKPYMNTAKKRRLL
ncbi:U3 small nucleolar ribonucleoprotein IMP4 [Angomonas deanei]|uniref:Brix domain containing protein, putative n=1 Tax=Angomonas deanei TaxID=59799 RepID=A0A7G2CH30_9TRYP|nr:U3 small nucleolar ribonucleoprotein IMP4 [Angomonas deanei]CAD2218204.1 Brix domain containing protein, putative [Angomonas deanei]|eukprot:EPY29740.1 U3 small nucleolar ribonucleoprotein IMP4 [Angomonas deanei]